MVALPMRSLFAMLQLLLSIFIAAGSATFAQEYDYVIVGGGIGGLVVANRLTEDKTKSVLVIEAGDRVDTDATKVPYKANDPAITNGLKWDEVVSQPEPELGGKRYPVIVAKVLGGGSVINGLLYDRGSAADYDAWEALGNPGWGWGGLEPYFKKGTMYQPAPAEDVQDFDITWNASTYGNGPLTVSIPDTQYADVKDYWKAWNETGVYVPQDGNSGDAFGPSWYPITMDRTTGRRAHARYAYYDPIQERRNLDILTQTTAHRIILDDANEPRATGVEVIDAAGNSSIICAKKEVILAAGAIHTPKLLQLSGIGPISVLEAAGIEAKVELDAVGSNLQDHSWANIILNTTTTSFPNVNSLLTNATFNASSWEEYETNKTGLYTHARGNAFTFLPLLELRADHNIDDIVKSLDSQVDEEYLPDTYKQNRKLLAGFRAQRKLITEIFQRRDAAVAELPITPNVAENLCAVHKPLSRGTIQLNPSNPNGPPTIRYNAFVSPIDRKILGMTVRYFRSVWQSPTLDKFKISEAAPGTQYETDEDIFNASLDQGILAPSQYHAAGSCSMMPQHFGGCVGPDLLVYGTRGLSIADASIMPIIPSAHLQATVYGIGEKAADIIKARH